LFIERIKVGAVASQFVSGSIWINKHSDTSSDTPFVGAKMPGVSI